MKTLNAIIMLFVLNTIVVTAQVNWDPFGDNYPTTSRAYSDISNFFSVSFPTSRWERNLYEVPLRNKVYETEFHIDTVTKPSLGRR
jgi:hypothetical protein